MPRVPNQDHARIALRLSRDEKARVMRAAFHSKTDITTFVMQAVKARSDEVLEAAERVMLTESDIRMIMDLLDHPPQPTDALKRAVQSLPPRDQRLIKHGEPE
jgi:uncharacterized protein (DUF1778 family)